MRILVEVLVDRVVLGLRGRVVGFIFPMRGDRLSMDGLLGEFSVWL